MESPVKDEGLVVWVLSLLDGTLKRIKISQVDQGFIKQK